MITAKEAFERGFAVQSDLVCLPVNYDFKWVDTEK